MIAGIKHTYTTDKNRTVHKKLSAEIKKPQNISEAKKHCIHAQSSQGWTGKIYRQRRGPVGLNFPIRAPDLGIPGPSGSALLDNEEEMNVSAVPEQETPINIETQNEQSVEPEEAPEKPEDGTQTYSGFGNFYNNDNSSNQPLRRSARIPNAKPRELYPGSVKYV